MKSHTIIKYPLSTEKSIRIMESENRLLFIVDRSANKDDIKKAVEELFKVRVVKVNTMIDHDGKKKAYVKISAETPAINVATQLGLM